MGRAVLNRLATATLMLLLCMTVTGCDGDNEKATPAMPDFHSQEIEADGEAVTVQARWFEKPIPVAETDTDTLPNSATKVFVLSRQAMLEGNDDVYIDRHADASKAKSSLKALKKMADTDRREFLDDLKNKRVIGEVRAKGHDLVVTRAENESNFGIAFLTHAGSGKFAIAAVDHESDPRLMAISDGVADLIRSRASEH